MSGLWTLFPAYSFGEFRCAARQRAQSFGKFRRWIFLFALVSLIRVGEASNPGPSVHFDAHSFTLGTCNPSGLRNKAHYFQTHMSYGDLWTVAETHFFGKDVSRFRAGLCAAKSAHRYCITDRQATRKNLVSQTAWKGVAILAKHPTRAIPSNVPSHILDSGRALITATLFGDAWVSGAVVYGEPNSHLYPGYLRNNEHILHHVASHVCHLCSGPRFLAGDWNVSMGSLPVFDLLSRAGFRDIQEVALERWGHEIQFTCKGRTRRDFLFLSPEMQELLTGLEVVHDVWPDHSMLVGSFKHPRCCPPLWVWPMPEQMTWPKQFAEQICWPAQVEDMSAAYAQLWEAIETSATMNSPIAIPKRACGRASRTQPISVRSGLFSPTKVARKGDFQPGYFGPSVRHSQWVRQARRLQAYARLTTSASAALPILRVEAWSAICRAKGFSPDFSVWWQESEFKTGNAPHVCPPVPPDGNVAVAMYESLVMALNAFEKVLRNTSRQYAKLRRDQNPALVFSDIRPPAIPGVDILLQPIRAEVESVEPAEGKIVLTHDCSFAEDCPIACAGVPLEVIHHSADAIWVSDVSAVEVGAEISQQKFIGTHAELETEFVAAWKQRWMRHGDVPASRWNQIVSFAHQRLPRLQLQWPALTVPDLKQVLRHKKKTTSPGFDGVTLLDLQRMPDTVLQAFCDMFAQSECTGSWPSQLVDGRVISFG